MTITLSPEAQRLIEEKMKQGGFASPDELVLFALQNLEEVQGADYEDLDEETRAAIERGEAQFQRGEGMTVEEVRERLWRKHFNK
jgi:Arc/MetJ-type ribon-helix-helix transcriptional regulator